MFSTSPRPIHRWKSFWIGILALTFLGWAWVRSMTVREVARWHGPSQEVAIVHEAGVVSIDICGSSGPPGPSSFEWQRSDTLMDGSWVDGEFQPRPGSRFPKPIHPRYFEYGSGYGFGLAHWLLILLFIAPWLAFLIARKRHIQHATEISEAIRNEPPA
jgi:hypothetical protein